VKDKLGNLEVELRKEENIQLLCTRDLTLRCRETGRSPQEETGGDQTRLGGYFEL